MSLDSCVETTALEDLPGNYYLPIVLVSAHRFVHIVKNDNNLNLPQETV